MSDLPETIWVVEDESSGDESASIMADLYCAYEKGVLVGNPEQFTRTDTIPTWHTDMEAARIYGDVTVWREDAGVFVAFFGNMELFNLSDEDIEAVDEETFFQDDWWTFGFYGPVRLEGDLKPTAWISIKPPTP